MNLIEAVTGCNHVLSGFHLQVDKLRTQLATQQFGAELKNQLTVHSESLQLGTQNFSMESNCILFETVNSNWEPMIGHSGIQLLG